MKPFAVKFYKSQRWQDCRLAYFKYQNGICERCGQAGKIVHHKVHLNARNIHNPRITLGFDNLELLCQDCHNKEHAGDMQLGKDKKKKPKHNPRYSIDENGNILPPGQESKHPRQMTGGAYPKKPLSCAHA